MSVGIPVAEARESLGGIVNRVAVNGERIALSENGRNVAVLVSVEDAERLEAMEDEKDLADAERRLADPAQVPIPFVVTK